jgi:prevent-host-death family protein
MTIVGVTQLKARLSEYLARVKAGEEVVVTDHGRPVAKLVPAFDADEHLRELERQGLVRIGTGKLPPGFFDLPRPTARESVLEALLEERREGR